MYGKESSVSVKITVAVCGLLSATGAFAQSSSAIDLHPLYDAIVRVGHDGTMGANTNGQFGLAPQSVPEKEVVLNVPDQRAAEAYALNGKQYLVLSHKHGPDLWVFLFESNGTLLRSAHGRPGAGMQAMDSPEESAAEEIFWLRWLADGAAVPPHAN